MLENKSERALEKVLRRRLESCVVVCEKDCWKCITKIECMESCSRELDPLCLWIASLWTRNKKGDELWFQLETHLLRAGLDPERDTTHILDEELIKVFGTKVQNKGYSYKNAAVEQVTSLAEELYMPIYQFDSPPDQFIHKSFARALVFEVCHGMPMNWSRYAEGIWGRKKGNKIEQYRHETAPTIQYKPVVSH